MGKKIKKNVNQFSLIYNSEKRNRIKFTDDVGTGRISRYDAFAEADFLETHFLADESVGRYFRSHSDQSAFTRASRNGGFGEGTQRRVLGGFCWRHWNKFRHRNIRFDVNHPSRNIIRVGSLLYTSERHVDSDSVGRTWQGGAGQWFDGLHGSLDRFDKTRRSIVTQFRQSGRLGSY